MSGSTEELGGVYYTTGRSSIWGWLALIALLAYIGTWVALFLGMIEKRPPEAGWLLMFASVASMIWLRRQ